MIEPNTTAMPVTNNSIRCREFYLTSPRRSRTTKQMSIIFGVFEELLKRLVKFCSVMCITLPNHKDIEAECPKSGNLDLIARAISL